MLEYVHHVAYAVADMEEAVALFRDRFGLEPVERKVAEGPQSFEMATFRCGPTLIELQRPIHYLALERFLRERGPGLTHVAFAVKDLAKRTDELAAKGFHLKPPGVFVAGTGWTIANLDLERSGLPLFRSPYHDDHLAEA